MTDITTTVNQPLVYNGIELAQKGDTFSLTAFWKAAGSEEAKRPANWSRKDGKDFIAHVAEIHNVPVRHIIKGTRGKGGVTYAHWQIALAYARYLNHDFHMWCNEVVRERMEGRSVSTANLPGEVVEMIERSFGIQRMLAHKVTEMEKAIANIGQSDPEKGSAVEFVTSKKVMTDYGFQTGEIRGRAGQLTHRLRKFSLEHHRPMRLTSEMKRNLFHVDAVRDWMEAGGRNWLTNKLVEVRSKAAGQSHLKLVS